MNDFEKYLRDNRLEAPAEDQFLIETNARLNSVEGIKRTVDSERRRGRVAVVVALVTGLVAGVLLSALILLHPVVPDISVLAEPAESFLDGVAATLHPWRYYIFFLVAGCAVALSVLSINGKKESR
ncbi:MAG: hypothetical protein K6G79_04560 [Bacteroidales bacterium]|nr:hypothetical protein [Bacteroidales bacterium]